MLSLFAYFVAAATALGVLAGGLRGAQYLGRVLLKAVRTMDSISRIVPVWYQIASEFENNGGASLKDRIERIDKTVVDLMAGQARQRQSLDSHSSTLDGQNHVLEQIYGRVERLEKQLTTPDGSSERR